MKRGGGRRKGRKARMRIILINSQTNKRALKRKKKEREKGKRWATEGGVAPGHDVYKAECMIP